VSNYLYHHLHSSPRFLRRRAVRICTLLRDAPSKSSAANFTLTLAPRTSVSLSRNLPCQLSCFNDAPSNNAEHTDCRQRLSHAILRHYSKGLEIGSKSEKGAEKLRYSNDEVCFCRFIRIQVISCARHGNSS
jgi:hypothetical protein